MWINADAGCYAFNFWPHTNRLMLLKKSSGEGIIQGKIECLNHTLIYDASGNSAYLINIFVTSIINVKYQACNQCIGMYYVCEIFILGQISKINVPNRSQYTFCQFLLLIFFLFLIIRYYSSILLLFLFFLNQIFYFVLTFLICLLYYRSKKCVYMEICRCM